MAASGLKANPIVRTVVQGLGIGIGAALSAGCGYLWGHVYAHFAHLPKGRVAQCYAIVSIATYAIRQLSSLIFDNRSLQGFISLSAQATTMTVFTHEMLRKGLMGPKMATFHTVVSIIWLAGGFFYLFDLINKANKNKKAQGVNG